MVSGISYPRPSFPLNFAKQFIALSQELVSLAERNIALSQICVALP
jgi:hypothetical protein